MPDNASETLPSSPPPKGDEKQAEKYLKTLTMLLQQNKLTVRHTDLSQFDPTSLEDHYRMDLKDYQVELSHSKNPNTGADSYILLFTNLKQVQEGCEKIILAYTNLTASQFQNFRDAAQTQVDERKRIEEQKRFEEVMTPIDQALSEAENTPAQTPNPLETKTSEAQPSEDQTMATQISEDTPSADPIPSSPQPDTQSTLSSLASTNPLPSSEPLKSDALSSDHLSPAAAQETPSPSENQPTPSHLQHQESTTSGGTTLTFS